MKKILFALALLAGSALLYQSCQPVDNSKALAKADSLATAKLTALKDSIGQACMDSIMARASLMADSMMNAAMKKPAPPKKKTPSTEGTVKDRPGATGPDKVTDRQGTTQQGPKTVNDRSGAQKKEEPPKM